MSELRHEHFPMHTHQHSNESMTEQSEPAIFSETYNLVFHEKVTSESIQQALTLWIEEIKGWAKGNAYLVGHVKIFVEGQENLWLSSAGRSINIKHSQGWSEFLTEKVTLSVTAIIFGTSKKALEEVAQERLLVGLKSLEPGV